ncbi:FtsX-like permease family protein [Thalassotalea marina]|nr:FtsX-like permease family protein [Thalassotalea marina]
MITNNTLFSLQVEWRRWHGQYVKLFLLLMGFAISAALLTMAVRLGSMLFYENPNWTNTDKPLYTIGRLHEDMQLQTVSRQTLEQLKTLPMVDDVSWLSFKTFSFTFENQPINNLNAMVFSDNLQQHLGITLGPEQNRLGIWLTDRYWRMAFNADAGIVGKVMSYKRIAEGLPILGVLDQKFDQVGTKPLDFWISKDILPYNTPFGGGAMAEKFLLAAPLYYGIFSSSQRFNISDATKQLESLDLTVKGMNFGQISTPLTMFSGVVLDPKAQHNMTLLWGLLIGLIITLFVILTFTLFAISTSRTILFANEYNTLRLLGAESGHLLSSSVLFSIVKLVVIALLTWLCIYFISSMLEACQGYQQRFPATEFAIEAKNLIGALLAVSFTVILCALIPMTNLLKRSTFTRMTNQSKSFVQKIMSDSTLALQLCASLVAIYVLAFIGVKQWQQYYESEVDLTVSQLEVFTGNYPIAWQQVLEKIKQQDSSAVIVSRPFDSPFRVNLEDERIPDGAMVDSINASSNYFSLLKTKVVGQIPDNWQSGVVINQSLAKRLQPNGDINALIGTSISHGLPAKQHTIIAIAQDLPHLGRTNAVVPAMYFSLNEYEKETLNNFAVLTSEINYLEKNSDFVTWLKTQSPEFKASETQTLEQVLATAEQQSTDLLLAALIVTIVIVLGVFSGLWYQMLSQLRVDKQNISVLVAIGAPDSFVFLSRFKKILIIFVAALIVCLLATVLFEPANKTLSDIDPLALLVAMVSTLLVCLTAVLIPVKRLLAQPIQQALRDL